MSDELNLEGYLNRVGAARPASPTAEALAGLHEAHATTIPFENIDIQLGRPIELDLASLQRKLVGDRRGGYCFEQNGLFGAVLAALGYPVVSLAARVRISGHPAPPRTHQLLSVHAGGRQWLCDVGFGGDGLYRPIPLEEGEHHGGGARYRLRARGDELWLAAQQGAEWQELYSFTREALLPMDFVVANWFTSTHPRSPFFNTLTAQRLMPDGERRILRNRSLVVRQDNNTYEHTLASEDELRNILAEQFGLTLEPEMTLRNPRFEDA